MGNGIGFVLAEVIAEWRLAHPKATTKELISFLEEFSASHKYRKFNKPKSIHDRIATTYIMVSSKPNHSGNSR